MRQNRPIFRAPIFTHEGGAARHISPIQQLRRSVLSCLLWEQEFYESGVTIAERIMTTAAQVEPALVAALAIEARTQFHLRHVPLLLLCVLQRTAPKLVAATVAQVLQRADEPAELFAVYRNFPGNGRNIPRQMRIGVAKALTKFDAYQLGKYNREGAFSLRDVFRIARPKPFNDEQRALWNQVVKGTLASPDTWEVALSAGADKGETFSRLLREGNLGYFALLRNLRNMDKAGVDHDLIRDAIMMRQNGADRILPFRFIAAARAAPVFELELDSAMVAGLGNLPQLDGTTAILVDVSGSMSSKLSAKSDLTRMDAAAALASIFPGRVRLFSFSNYVHEVPPRNGMAGVDAILRSQAHGGTMLGMAVQAVNNEIPHDRMIVITDEQAHDSVPANVRRSYMINVASAKNGVGYGAWTHIDGFSENIIRFIAEAEASASLGEDRPVDPRG